MEIAEILSAALPKNSTKGRLRTSSLGDAGWSPELVSNIVTCQSVGKLSFEPPPKKQPYYFPLVILVG